MVSNSVLLRLFAFARVKNTILFFVLMFFSTACCAKKIEKSETEKGNFQEIKTDSIPKIKTGADSFLSYLPLLKDKKIGIVTNQTGILSNKTHLVDFLLSKNTNIQTIFAPEHGFRGTSDAGEDVV